VLAVMHGVRSGDVIRIGADLDAAAGRRCWMPMKVDTDGLVVVRGAHGCWPACPRRLGHRGLRAPSLAQRRLEAVGLPIPARGVRRRGHRGKPDPEGFLGANARVAPRRASPSRTHRRRAGRARRRDARDRYRRPTQGQPNSGCRRHRRRPARVRVRSPAVCACLRPRRAAPVD
jgi:hypothetical protein